jgi:hypothetical protein
LKLASILKLPLPICTFAGTGIRFSPGVTFCIFDGCICCARDGTLTNALNIIRLSPLNQTFDFPIICAALSVNNLAASIVMFRAPHTGTIKPLAQCFFPARTPLPVPQITGELE